MSAAAPGPPRHLRERLARWMPSQSTVRCSPWTRWLALADDSRLWSLRRDTVCQGAAIGALASVIPLPVQIPVAVIAALRLRANIPAAIAGTFISNPFTIIPIWAAAWHVGALVTGATVAPDWSALTAAYMNPLAGLEQALSLIGLPILVGLPIVGVAIAAVTYAALSLGWRYSASRRWGARTAGRSSAKTVRTTA